MNPPEYMAYVIIGGVMLVSLIIPAIIGFADAWYVPLIVFALGVPYLLFDRRMRNRSEQH